MQLLSDLFCTLVRIVFGTSVYTRGFDPAIEAQRIFYANHSSHLDALLIWASLPSAIRHKTRPVAALDYWGGGGIRTFVACRLFNSILIDRDRSTGEDPLEPLRTALKNGSSIIIFPEGTRSTEGELQSFKSGIYHLASDCPGIELTPVYLHNLNRILPKGEHLPVPLLSRVIFGGPVFLKPSEEKQLFINRIRDCLQELSP